MRRLLPVIALISFQVLAGQGLPRVPLDGRGTPGRGRDFERTILRRLGKNGVRGHAPYLPK